MTKSIKRKDRREKTSNINFLDSTIAREKQKARDLRNSSWWRKKIAPGICHYCGEKFPPQTLTMDHMIPLSRGGKSEKINLVPACKTCNNKKKYMLPVEWDEYINTLNRKPESTGGVLSHG